MDPEFKYDKNPIVFLREEGVMGVVVEYGAHTSLVKYLVEGEMFEEMVENDEFVVVDNILIKHYEED